MNTATPDRHPQNRWQCRRDRPQCHCPATLMRAHDASTAAKRTHRDGTGNRAAQAAKLPLILQPDIPRWAHVPWSKLLTSTRSHDRLAPSCSPSGLPLHDSVKGEKATSSCTDCEQAACAALHHHRCWYQCRLWATPPGLRPATNSCVTLSKLLPLSAPHFLVYEIGRMGFED